MVASRSGSGRRGDLVPQKCSGQQFSRRSDYESKVREGEDAIANTRDACATQHQNRRTVMPDDEILNS